MADTSVSQRPLSDLLVTFSREGEVEEREVCANGDEALRMALVIISHQDALRAGDVLRVEAQAAPNLIDRGLA
jgi:hypothetical protein